MTCGVVVGKRYRLGGKLCWHPRARHVGILDDSCIRPDGRGGRVDWLCLDCEAAGERVVKPLDDPEWSAGAMHRFSFGAPPSTHLTPREERVQRMRASM